ALLERLHGQVPMEDVVCPYADSPSRYRNDKPMEVSALQATHRHREEMWGLFAHLSHEGCRRRGFARASLEGLHLAGVLATQLPGFLIARRESPLKRQGELPPAVAGLAKSADGLQSVTYAMLSDGVAGALTLSAQQVLDVAERRKMMVGGAKVCAAPN